MARGRSRSRLDPYRPFALATLRIVTALIFIQHGTNKLFQFPEPTSTPGMFVLFGRVGVVGLMDAIGGILILLGLWTRPVAFLLCGEMACAYWFFHVPHGFHKPNGWAPFQNGGDLSIMFCFVFFYLIFAGAGPWSLDDARGSRRPSRR